MSTPSGTFATLADLVSATQGIDVSPGFTLDSQSAAVSFAVTNLQPPASLYVTQNDQIRIVVTNFDPSLILLTLKLRFLTAAGERKIFEYTISGFDSAGTSHGVNVLMSEGFILAAIVSDPAGLNSSVGRCWAEVTLTRGQVIAGEHTQTLCYGYVARTTQPAFPPVEHPIPYTGPGFLGNVPVADPPAGSNWSVTVPTNQRWKVYGLLTQLHCSAAVANRTMQLLVLAGGAQISALQAPFVQTASTTGNYTFAPGYVPNATFQVQNILPLPRELILRAGDVIETVVSGLDVADQLTITTLRVEKWADFDP